MSRRVRCLQIATAATALFAVLGACGLPASGRRTRVVVRPRPPRAEVTIRSLTGTWEAMRQRSGGDDTLIMVLVQSGDMLTGTLRIEGRTLTSTLTTPARIDATGRFAICFGQTHEAVEVGGRVATDSDRIAAEIRGLGDTPVGLIFRRR
jgi:hypothetical protein